jgi:hypothetical protein
MELLTRTSKELRRIQTLQRVADGYLTQAAAAAELGLCERQVRRLAKAVARDGPAALAPSTTPSPPSRASAMPPSSTRPRRCRCARRSTSSGGLRFARNFRAFACRSSTRFRSARAWAPALARENATWRSIAGRIEASFAQAGVASRRYRLPFAAPGLILRRCLTERKAA